MAVHEKTVIENHPWLARIFGASSPIGSLYFAVPLLVTLIWLASVAGLAGPARAVLVLAGVLYWTFIEYAMHRWFYHWRPRNVTLRRCVESFHVYHHRNPTDPRVYNAGFMLGVPVALLLSIPVWLLTWSTAVTASVMVGTTIGYYAYEWFHYTMHTRTFDTGYMARMQRLHLLHHERDWRANFGVTNIGWDRLFGTVREEQQ